MFSKLYLLVLLTKFTSALVVPELSKGPLLDNSIKTMTKRSTPINVHTQLEGTVRSVKSYLLDAILMFIQVYPMTDPKFALQSGTCLNAASSDTSCQAYCETTELWFWGAEVPYANSFCTGNEVCTLANAQSVTITNTYTFSLSASLGFKRDTIPAASSLKGVFDAGASYSWSEAIAYTTTTTFPKPTDVAGECGYFTLIPYYIQ